VADVEAGYAKENEISIEVRGIEPVPPSQRYGKPWRLFFVWFAPQLTMTSFFIGALGPAFGLGFGPSLAMVVLGNLLGAIPLAYLSTWGPKTGLAQLPLSRTAFGRAIKLPAILNWLSAIGWQAYNNVFASTALNLLFGVPLWVGVLLVFAGQLIISVFGYELVHQFAKYASWGLIVVFVILGIKIFGGEGTTHLESAVAGADLVGMMILMFVAAASLIFTWSTYAADYSRYLPEDSNPKQVFWAVHLGVASAAIWMEILGLLVADRVLSGGVSGASGTIQQIMGGGLLGAAGLIAIYLGIVSANSLNDYTGSLSLQAGGIKMIRPVTAALTGAISFAATLFFIYGSEDLASKTTNFLLFISYWIGAWYAIVLVDWLRRRGLVDANAVADERRLHAGTPAVIALVLGFIAAIPFSNTTFGYNFVTSNPDSPIGWLVGRISTEYLHGADLGFLVGFVVAAVVYSLSDKRRGAQEMYLPVRDTTADRVAV
jgi:nucleobase:cation symporter-1, NCS1 family